MTQASAVNCDVVIVGAGLVGLALAAALAQIGLTVAIADRVSVAVDMPDADDDWDNRVYAISPGSAALLHSLGAWQRLPTDRITAIETMDVRGDAGGALGFSAYEQGVRALAWIVENRTLHEALAATVRVAPAVAVLAPCVPESIAWRRSGGELRLADGRTVSARLVVGADGVRSWTREQAGLRHVPRPYDQNAVVANFAVERAHRGRAFQWFLKDRGVLAWLPLPGRRISIVWSAPVALAEELMTLAPTALSECVSAAGNRLLGRFERITAAAMYPLTFLKLPSIIGSRLALVGDAAHGVHPLAGQGVNLGFGDVAALSSALAVHSIVGDAGDPLLLERYARRRAEAVLAMQATTDGLVRLFASPHSWVRTLRNGGMGVVDSLPMVKALLAQPALR